MIMTIGRRTATALATLLLSTGISAAQDIGGTYSVEGKNPNGSTYTGTARIEGTEGGNCSITWTIGNGQSSEAFCMRQGEVLGAAYVLGKSIGLVIYRVDGDGVLDGTWSIAGEEGVGQERLTPQ
ncbi:MAG: hypothetical protein ACK50Q_12245 [Labrys sp. (in: a-proteobacteria)]